VSKINAKQLDQGVIIHADIIDGNEISAQVRAEVRKEVKSLLAKGVSPTLAIILIGQKPSSRVYANSKIRACHEMGIEARKIELAKDVPEQDLLDQIDRLNRDTSVHGVLVQLPLPHHINSDRVIERIDPAKDVDGFHPDNVGKLSLGLDCLLPCTPAAIPELISRCGIELPGKHVVIVGRGNFLAKPIMNLLVQKGNQADCTVTCCHSHTDHLANYTRQADILIAAIGVPKFITAGMVKDGAVVIDLGANHIEDPEHSHGARLVGDVDFNGVGEVAGAITPVPGGVGPMTVAMLMKNTTKAARRIHRLEGV
jgi:methylenetetrahydrofolate dehydrogenase (NADP+)/methenyltetrahydrofolate cyclohydrolase